MKAKIADSAALKKSILKLAVAGLLLFLIFRSVDSRSTAAAIAAASPILLLAALLCQTVCNATAALRWRLIMAQLGFKQPTLFYLQSFFKGVFFNQGLPTSIGGDGIRILDCVRQGSLAEDAFFGVFIDRVVGLTGLLLLNMAALLLSRHLLPPRVEYPLLVILAGLTSGLVLLVLLRKFSFFTVGKYRSILGRLSERYVQIHSSPSLISLQLGLSIFVHLLSMSAFFLIGKAVGLHYAFHVYLVLVPPVILLTILPISLAGWGVREGAMVGFFLLIGADKEKILALSLLYGLTMLASSLPGLAVYLTEKQQPTADER